MLRNCFFNKVLVFLLVLFVGIRYVQAQNKTILDSFTFE
jgi:hypothetical protein